MLCTVLISVICSSVAHWWPGSNWQFWANPLLTVANAPTITRTIFVPTLHILLTSISRSLYLLSFSVSCELTFESSGMAISISMQVFSFFIMQHCIMSVCLYWWSVITGTSHITVVLLTFMTYSDIHSVACMPYIYTLSSRCNQPPYCVY